MGLASAFALLADDSLPASYDGLKSHIDIAWIQASLARSGVASVRRRKLPVEQAVWLVIGLALSMDRPISDVVNHLDLALPDENGERQQVSLAAVIKVRDLVGAQPMEDLFRTTAQHWALGSADRLRWRGLMVLGIDGTTMRVPDTGENRDEFGLPGSSRRTAAYPQIRAVGLMVLRSHLLLDFEFSRFDAGEITQALPMVKRIPDDSLTIFDRGYIYFYLWRQISTEGKNRHWLCRARTNQKGVVVERFSRNDCIMEFHFSHVERQKHPDLPETFQARAVKYCRRGFRPGIVLTSLLDPKKYPSSEIVALYHERWELELGFDEIKTHQLERLESIRSKSPERVKQEVWGIAIAYNLIRQEMEASAVSLDLPPRRLSFLMSLRLIRDLFGWAAIAKPGALPKMLIGLRRKLTALILPERRTKRSFPRHIKVKMSQYPRNPNHPA